MCNYLPSTQEAPGTGTHPARDKLSAVRMVKEEKSRQGEDAGSRRRQRRSGDGIPGEGMAEASARRWENEQCIWSRQCLEGMMGNEDRKTWTWVRGRASGLPSQAAQTVFCRQCNDQSCSGVHTSGLPNVLRRGEDTPALFLLSQQRACGMDASVWGQRLTQVPPSEKFTPRHPKLNLSITRPSEANTTASSCAQDNRQQAWWTMSQGGKE